jgi:hypothetical protein
VWLARVVPPFQVRGRLHWRSAVLYTLGDLEFVVEEDGKVVASFEMFDNEYVFLLEGEKLGQEILMLLQAGWRVEF